MHGATTELYLVNTFSASMVAGIKTVLKLLDESENNVLGIFCCGLNCS